MISSYNTQFIGKVYHHLKTVGSTNDFAANLTKTEDVIEGSVVRADHQTKGKGQQGNEWESVALENLTMSVVLKPTFLDLKNLYILNMSMALSARDTIASILQEHSVKIKWPNDIYVDSKKLAGLLIENTLRPDKLALSIVGIGINVNQKSFPKHLSKASSLSIIANKDLDPDQVYRPLLFFIEQWYNRLRQSKIEEIREAYFHHLLYFKKRHLFQIKQASFMAEIVDVLPSGKLVVQRDTKQYQFDMKEVIF